VGIFLACSRASKERIQDGDYGAEAHSVSSMNQKPYGDAGATLGGNKAQRRIKTLTF
jgi:hypothetical protein